MVAESRSVARQWTERVAVRTPETSPALLAYSDLPPVRTEELALHTGAGNEFWDLTAIVAGVLARSRVRHGQVTISTPHTTTSIVVNEAETGFFNDFRRLITTLVPTDGYYEHDDDELRTENLQPDELINGHAHCRQLLVGQPSVTIPVVDGAVLLGRWQRIMFLELDQARLRRVYFHAAGT